jgi:hypothetical protein
VRCDAQKVRRAALVPAPETFCACRLPETVDQVPVCLPNEPTVRRPDHLLVVHPRQARVCRLHHNALSTFQSDLAPSARESGTYESHARHCATRQVCPYAVRPPEPALHDLVLRPHVARDLHRAAHGRPDDRRAHPVRKATDSLRAPDRRQPVPRAAVCVLCTNGQCGRVCLDLGLDEEEWVGQSG